MPVEIKELVIRAEVDYQDTERGEPCSDSPATTGKDVDTEALVQACVKQVMKILKQEKQR